MVPRLRRFAKGGGANVGTRSKKLFTGSIAARPGKMRKDGAPSVVVAPDNAVKGHASRPKPSLIIV
jgi:hypothetical protein